MNPAYPIAILENIFKLLYIDSVVLLMVCSSDEVKIKIMREFSRNGYMVSFSIDAIKDRPERRRGAVLDISCGESQTILNRLSSNKAFNVNTEWLLLDIENNKDSKIFVNKELANTYILPGSCVILARFNFSEKSVCFFDTYRMALWSKVKYTRLFRQAFNETVIFPGREIRKDFERVTYRGATAVVYPEFFDGVGSLAHPEADTYLQVTHFVMKNIAQMYNFQFTLHLDREYGYRQPNGTYNGIIGRLLREELDFGPACMMRNDRMDAVDFAGNIFQLTSPLIFRQPSLPSVSNIFLLPFERSVWIAGIGLSLVTIAVLLIELVTSIKVFKYWKPKELSSGEVVMAVIGHVSQQGALLELKSLCGQIILVLFSIFSFFLSIAYAAKIVVLLQSSTNSIQSLPQLVKSPLTVGIQDALYNKVYIKETNDPYVEELLKKKIFPNGKAAFVLAEEGIKRVRSGFYAFKIETNWAYKLIAETFMEREKCGLSELPVFLFPMLSIPIPKKSGLKEHFSRSVCWQKEVGLYYRIITQVTSPKPVCNAKGIGYTSVHLRDFKPALQAYFIGLVMAAAIFIAEIIMKIRFLFYNILKKKRIFRSSKM